MTTLSDIAKTSCEELTQHLLNLKEIFKFCI